MQTVKLREQAVERLYSLDILRGIAALSVVFWHWNHFFFIGTRPGPIDTDRLPLSEWIPFLYSKGFFAVDFFFSLSGFVFFWLYSRRIAEGGISAGRFALLRFSRLYPLHVLCLLIVALGQLLTNDICGEYFVYEHNDIKHFLLNVLFAQSWGLEDGYSFNGPAWSISVEIFLYGLFFATCRSLSMFPRPILLVLFSMIGFIVLQPIYSPIGRGIGSFFLGGSVFLIYEWISSRRSGRAIAAWLATLTFIAWFVALAAFYFDQEIHAILAAALHSSLTLSVIGPYLQWMLRKATVIWPVAVLFPLTILSLALFETYAGGSQLKRLSFLGDISYSSYLLQFPLQLLFFVSVIRLGLDKSIFYSTYFMSLYFAVLVTVSLLSHQYVELPLQKFLRRSWRGEPALQGVWRG